MSKLKISKHILDFMNNNPSIGRKKLSEKLGISESLARDYVAAYRYSHNFIKDNVDVKDKIMKILKKGAISKRRLANKIGVKVDDIPAIISKIEKETGLPIYYDGMLVQINPAITKDMPKQYYPNLNKKSVRIGIVSDTHFCSKYQQISALHKAYEHFEEKKVDLVIHSGDLSDGSPNMHRGITHEQFLHTFEEHLLYAINQYPKSNNFKTYMRPGNHDDSWKKNDSGDIVRMLSRFREDIVYLSPQNPLIQLDSGVKIEAFHPAGGMPYAKSYRGQKIYEAEVNKCLAKYYSQKKLMLPDILLIGHLHSFEYHINGYTHVFLVPCFQSTTPYIMSKSLSSTVGYLILDLNISEDGNITKLVPNVYDMGAYVKENDY